MKTIQVQFHNGIQAPPKLGTLILRKTAEGKLAYAQNVDSSSDKYGQGTIAPGPKISSIENDNVLTGVPFVKSFFGFGINNVGYLYFAQGLTGNQNTFRRVKDIASGLTPSLDTGIGPTTDHGPGHNNQVIVDMVFRPKSINENYIYYAGKDNADTWVNKFDAVNSFLSPENPGIATNSLFASGATNQFLVLGADNNIYWIGQDRVSSIDTGDNYVVDALINKLPKGTFASAGVDWNNYLVIAYTNDAFGDFGRRLSAGRAGVILWDYQNANFQKNIPAPCRYISALITAPNGNLLCFGGIDEGKTSIYEFTGYGFSLLYSYIGDMPRSRHSIEFDGQGRIYWVTADGQFCRFSISSGIFDHLGSV